MVAFRFKNVTLQPTLESASTGGYYRMNTYGSCESLAIRAYSALSINEHKLSQLPIFLFPFPFSSSSTLFDASCFRIRTKFFFKMNAVGSQCLTPVKSSGESQCRLHMKSQLPVLRPDQFKQKMLFCFRFFEDFGYSIRIHFRIDFSL